MCNLPPAGRRTPSETAVALEVVVPMEHPATWASAQNAQRDRRAADRFVRFRVAFRVYVIENIMYSTNDVRVRAE